MADTCTTHKKRKTWGRESAAWLLIMLTYCVWMENAELTTLLVWPTITYCSIAFGLKRLSDDSELRSIATFSPDGRGSERSSQRTGRTDEYPTSRSEPEGEEHYSNQGQYCDSCGEPRDSQSRQGGDCDCK